MVQLKPKSSKTKTKTTKKGLEMSKAIGELMKTSYLKCGKGEGSSRDVNLVFQSDCLSARPV